jgi:hypothetical protein|tara:strand:- start:44 stop:295 length:252 start_codon:yes stop_codon:yes gene_type:complete
VYIPNHLTNQKNEISKNITDKVGKNLLLETRLLMEKMKKSKATSIKVKNSIKAKYYLLEDKYKRLKKKYDKLKEDHEFERDLP